MQMSERLRAVASFVTEGNRVVDIGTDHGYVPIYLVKSGVCPKAIAMDVNRGPLERAAEHIKEEGMSGRIQTRLSDGFSAYQPGEADSVVIAGIGGDLMIRILKEGKEKFLGIKEFILSPHSEIERVREFLQENRFTIVKEDIIVEDEKYYVIMCVEFGLMSCTELELFYGKYLLTEQNPVLYEYLKKEMRTLKRIHKELEGVRYMREGEANDVEKKEKWGKRSEKRERRMEELIKKMERVQCALGFFSPKIE